MSDAPRQPGVYYLLSRDRELLYVGKARDLRKRLRDHERSGRWAHVADVRWELVGSETAALAREADVIAAIRPRHNKAHVEDFFSFVSVGPKGLAIGREGRYGCFPHLGTGAGSEAGRACIDGFNALARVVADAEVEPQSLHRFLSGQRNELELDVDGMQPHTAHGIRRDAAIASLFFDAGTRAMRQLRLRHRGRGAVTREQFCEWIRVELRELLGDFR